MDIDGFLDRELGTPTGPRQSGLEKDALPDHILTQHSEELLPGKVSEIAKKHEEVWKKLVRDKIRWDEDSYFLLAKMQKQMRKDIDSLYVDMINARTRISELIDRTNAFIAQKEIKHAQKSLDQMKDIYDRIDNVCLQEKKQIHEQITHLSQKISAILDHQSYQRATDAKYMVSRALIKVREAMKRRDNATAKLLYDKALAAYLVMPNVYLRDKLELGQQLLSLYKIISITSQIVALQEHLSQEAVAERQDTRHKQDVLQQILRDRTNVSTKPEVPSRPAVSGRHHSSIKKAIKSKLSDAESNMKAGNLLATRKKIEQVLRLDPGNSKASAQLKRLSK